MLSSNPIYPLPNEGLSLHIPLGANITSLTILLSKTFPSRTKVVCARGGRLRKNGCGLGDKVRFKSLKWSLHVI